jgi:hypothetical protein
MSEDSSKQEPDLAALLAEVKRLKDREASWENALQCLEAYLSQFPNQMLLRQMIQVWFSDVKES